MSDQARGTKRQLTRSVYRASSEAIDTLAREMRRAKRKGDKHKAAQLAGIIIKASQAYMQTKNAVQKRQTAQAEAKG